MVQLSVETTSVDGLHRPRTVVTTPAGAATSTSETRYADATHRIVTRDGRGILATRELDDLDRDWRTVADAEDGFGLLNRSIPNTTHAPVAAATTMEYDAFGHRRKTIDALGRVTEEVVDGLGRRLSRSLPMGVRETWTYDGEGLVLKHLDVRGIEHGYRFDALRRPVAETLTESLSQGGTVLTLSRREYTDVAEPCSELATLPPRKLATPARSKACATRHATSSAVSPLIPRRPEGS